ncbi:hypothetical protein H0H87_011670, partial [Tephrocybe sp. NHM501043]
LRRKHKPLPIAHQPIMNWMSSRGLKKKEILTPSVTPGLALDASQPSGTKDWSYEI